MEKAVVNCEVEVRNATLRKGNDSLMYQRAGKQLDNEGVYWDTEVGTIMDTLLSTHWTR